MRYTPDGRPYFVDHNTRTTTWVDPRRVQQVRVYTNNTTSQASVQVLQQTVSQLGPLPSGSEMRLTNTGRVYFVDHNTKTTTWDGMVFLCIGAHDVARYSPLTCRSATAQQPGVWILSHVERFSALY